jgi:hypothetical protein
MQFRFNRHRELEGLHAPFSPSQSSWLRYNDEKLVEVYLNKKAAERGTRLHQWAKETIDLGIKQPRSKQTIYAYINDAIGFRMETEVVLYYSDKHFGTADAISFKPGPNGRNLLRIHDLKTGKTLADMEQLKVYAALFCLEYSVNPMDIDIVLQIYQNDEIEVCEPTGDEIRDIMKVITHQNKILNKVDKEEV